MRARPGDADVDHGRHRPRRRARRAAPQRRGARGAGAGRHAGRRQDRHADGRQAGARPPSPRSAASTKPTLLRLVASLERVSEHPLAAAIVARRARRAASRLAAVTDFRSITGKGVVGVVDGRTIARRQRRAARRRSASIGGHACAHRADELRRDGETVMFVAVDGAAAGLIGVADPVKADHRRSHPRAARRGPADRDADRRQPRHRRRGGARRSASTPSKRTSCRSRRRRW